MRHLPAVLTVIVSLLLVGFIRSSTPPYTPSEYEILPDENGVASLETATVEVLGFEVAQDLRVDREYESLQLSTEHAFVLMRYRVTPHRETFFARVKLHTADGYTYDFVDVLGFPGLDIAYVGQVTTSTYVFEVPSDKVEGSWIGMHGAREDGLQPVWPLLRLDVVDPETHDGELLLPADVVEPAR